MEGKIVVITVLLLNLVVGQLQVEAKSRCPSTAIRNAYSVCRLTRASKAICASICGCKIVDGPTCPNGYTHDILQKTGGEAANEYCKLGCASSVCSAIATLQNFDQGELVNGAVEKCVVTCSALYTKYSIRAA